jgi:succinylarginine dihydrolase
MTTDLIEVNFDGLVGPTHHYGGLGVGNLASMEHEGLSSNPQAAALQGIEKIKLVASLADPNRVVSAVLPPQMRPNIEWLRCFGFSGSDAEVLQMAGRQAPRLLYAAWSASAMWTANAATVSPAPDCADDRLHLTVANLYSSLHRSLEHADTFATLSQLFLDRDRFCVHEAIPGGHAARDEGAANHMRLSGIGNNDSSQHPAIEIFVHGSNESSSGTRFFARQSIVACHAIARLHQLCSENTFFLQQHPAAVDAGAFHNDVVATSCGNVLIYHEKAFLDAGQELEKISKRYQQLHGAPLRLIEILESRVSLEVAVKSYLFNSQLIVTSPDGDMTLVCPSQCAEAANVLAEIEAIIAGDNPITAVQYADLHESMWNGGGPACLRLRVTLSGQDRLRMHQGVFWSDSLETKLTAFIKRHYRDRVTSEDLVDASFAQECWQVTTELRRLLQLNSLHL